MTSMKSNPSPKKSGKRSVLEITGGVAVTFVVFALFLTGAFQFLELKSIDWRFEIRGESTADPSIVIVAIDEASFSDLNLKWPWPRDLLASIVDRLSEENAAVIGIDIIMSEPFPGKQDETLAKAAGRAGNVYFSSKFEQVHRRMDWQGKEIEIREEVLKGPVPVIAQSGAVGYLNLPQDNDGFVRRFTPIREFQEYRYTSFGLKIALRAAGIELNDIRYTPFSRLTAGQYSVPLNRYDSAFINFAGPHGKFRTISFSNVLAGEYPVGFFRDSVVLIGSAFRDSHDYFSTPFMKTPQKGSLPLYGVEVHANVINTFIHNRFFRQIPQGVTGGIVLLFGLLATVIGVLPSPGKGIACMASILVLWTGAAVWLFSRDMLVPLAAPLVSGSVVFVALVAIRYFAEEKEKRRIRDIFQKYVSPEVVAKLIRNPAAVQLGGEEKVLSVLFSDLEGFTSHSEQLSPKEMVLLLSEYYTEMTDQVFANEGMLKEYVGDEMMAIFGAPVVLDNHALAACRSALAMRDRLADMRRDWAARGCPQLRARTGINSGPMLVGNMGSRYRFSYGVMGDQVNLASRLEGLNKEYATTILISESTAAMVADDIVLREVDRVRVKGRLQTIRIYEPLAEASAAISASHRKAIQSYEKGLRAYRQQKWDEAAAEFRETLNTFPDDGPARVMSSRCSGFRENPPPKDWDGVFQQLTK